MAYKQLVQPRTSTQDLTGWCLRFTQSVFGAPAMHDSATIAANNTSFRHHTREMPNVAVPVWFDHLGTYGSPARYGNWGHVVAWVPGSGLLSSPPYAKFDARGNQIPWSQWYPSIEAVERAFNAKFRFWSEDINGLRVAEPTNQTETENDMIKLYLYTPTNSLLLVDHLNMTIRNLGNKNNVERSQFDRMPYTKISDPQWGQMAGGFQYITKPNVATDGIDVNALGKKIAADLAKLGVQGDAEATAAAVQRILADEFAAIPAKVAVEQSERLKG